MSSPLFIGLATALITPFTDEGVDFDALSHQIARQISAGATALVVCGTTGESSTMTQDEKDRVISFVVNNAAGSLKVIAGIGGNNTVSAAEAAKQAATLGVDAVMLSTPYYNKTNEAGLIRHFSYVADRTPVPMILYNVPGRTGVSCTETVYNALWDHPMICGVKEASGDISLACRVLSRCGDTFSVWSGNDDQTLPLMALGATGVISVASNIIPNEMNLLCNACLTDDIATARIIHYRFEELFKLLFSDVNPIPIKTAMNLIGMDAGLLRLPLYPMDFEKTQRLLDCLQRLELIA